MRKISKVRLQMGDLLLVQGPHDSIRTLEVENIRILGAVEGERPQVQRAPTAVAIFVAALAAAALGILSLPVAALLGALAAFVTRCITPEEAYRQVEWNVLILIARCSASASRWTKPGRPRPWRQGSFASWDTRIPSGYSRPSSA
jgi:di/tricarboxylate transporter